MAGEDHRFPLIPEIFDQLPNVDYTVLIQAIERLVQNEQTRILHTQTWTAIANDLYESSNIMTRGGISVYKVEKNGSTYSFTWNNVKDPKVVNWPKDYFAVG